MKNLVVLIVGVLLLLIFTVVFFQYRADITHARARVLGESEILATNNGEIEYAVKGEGLPVLLIHGAGGGYDQGLWFGETALGDGYQFISVSRYGYLRSPFAEESTVESQAALYVELLDHLGINKVVVFGGSAGGPSALQFAYDYPEKCMALVLVSAISMYMGDEIPLSTRIVNTIQRSDFAYWLVIKLFRSQFMEMVGISPEAYDSFSPEEKRLTHEMLEYMHPMSPRWPGNMHEINYIPLSAEALQNITVPTIILHARDDNLVSHDHAEHAHENIKHSVLVSFESGGHGLVAQSKVIREQIKDFLAENNLYMQ